VTLSATSRRSSRPIRVEPTPKLEWPKVERPKGSNPPMRYFARKSHSSAMSLKSHPADLLRERNRRAVNSVHD
jgi:hypothetical protein